MCVSVGSWLGVPWVRVPRRVKGPDSRNPKSTRQDPSPRAPLSAKHRPQDGKGEHGVEESGRVSSLLGRGPQAARLGGKKLE